MILPKTLDEWLKECPDPGWRIQVALRYKNDGVRQFGKVPVALTNYDHILRFADSIGEIGEVRPFLCPESAPSAALPCSCCT